MPSTQKALNDFLLQHCDIRLGAPDESGARERYYFFPTEDCLLFMAENYLQEIRATLDQTDEVLDAASKSGNYHDIVMAYNWNAPDPGMDHIRLPVTLVDTLDDKRALMLLRNLEGIQRDIDDGKARKHALQQLFGDTAHVTTAPNLDGERLYVVTGRASPSDRRRYMERYAEHVATNVLFDLPKALNAKLQHALPSDASGRFFVEGRDITARKIRYGSDAHIEMALIEEGAILYTDIQANSASLAVEISAILRAAMIDPFGLSLKYYMGKHTIIKL